MLDPAAVRRRSVHNLLQELLLLAGTALTFGAVAWLLFGTVALVAVVVAFVLVVLLRPRVPADWVMSMYGAQPLPRWASPHLHGLVDVLTERAGLHRRPRLYYVASPVANAFVVGRPDDAAVAITDGLLRLLNGRQMAGVLAHELSHVRHGDTSIMNLSDVVARLAQWMAWVGLWSCLITVPLVVASGVIRPALLSIILVVVPTIATLMQLALCRSREYDADLDAVTLTHDPEGLAQALIALDYNEGRIWERIMVGRSGGPDPLLLQTHPSTVQRVRRLRDLEVNPPRRLLGTPQTAAPLGYPPVTRQVRLRRPGIRW